MHAFVRFVRFLVAATLAVFALPAAATYYYSLNMCAYGTGCTSPIAMTTSVANVSTGTVTAIIKNESPANLTMKSFTLSVPAGSGLTITDATLPAGQTATKTIQGGTLTVKSMSIGIVKGAQYAVTLTVQTTQCTATTGNWTAQPWTGTALNGAKYVMYPVSATHPATTFTPACTVPITITANPTAGGSASCSPNPVPYGGGSTCSVSSTSPGYTFGVFSGACNGTTCTLSNVTTPQTVQANFTLISYAVTTVPAGNGTGTITPLNPASSSVPFGVKPTFTVTADPNSTLGSVTDTCGAGGSLSGNTYTAGAVPVGGCTVTATFTKVHYTITASAATNGSIAPSGAVDVVAGSDQMFTVTPTSPYHVKEVLVDSVPVGGIPPTGPFAYTFNNVQANHTIAASFVITNTGCDALQTSQGPGVSALDPYADVAFTTSNQWGVRSGPSLDGTTTGNCPNASYVFTLADKVASLISDRPPDSPGTVFKYVIVWPPVFVDTAGDQAGWSQKRPLVAWLKDISDAPVYVPALFCPIDPDDLSSYTTTALLDSLLPVIPSVEPFITLGVTYPQYAPGQRAKMCVSQQGATSFGRSPPDTGVIQIQYWDKVIDESDGYVKIGN